MSTWSVQFRRHHHPPPAYLRDEGVFVLQTPQTVQEIRPDLLHVVEKVLVLNGPQDRQGSATRHRIATKRRAVRAGSQGFGDMWFGHHHPDWHTACQTLGQGHDVWH